METIVKDFFQKSYEDAINEHLFIRSFNLNKDELFDYVNRVVEVKLLEYCNYVIDYCHIDYLTFQDVVQFSSLDDATTGICQVLARAHDGLHNLEVGQALLDDGTVRKEGAYRKYGENHAKTAIELGLVLENSGCYFLTCLGEIYNDLENSVQNELLRRTILRNRFFQKILIKSQLGPVFIENEMSFFSQSTIIRRLPNVRTLYNIMIGNDPELLSITKNISVRNFCPERICKHP